jgi:VWFA-related protein
MFGCKHLLLWMFLPFALCAQTPATFSTDVVNLFATVRDAQGHIVSDLTQDDFTLEEDGRPQTIRFFSHESGLPLTLGLLVDTSISQKRLLPQERTASLDFLGRVIRSESDHAFVMRFDREVVLLQDLTSSHSQLAQALAQLQTPQPPPRKRGDPKIGSWALGGTDLYDAVLLASDEILRRKSGRKAIVLLTDGVDNGSKVSLFATIQAALRANTLIYSILFSDRDAYDGVFASANGKAALERMSRETGAGFFEVSSAQSIAAIYAQLEDELRNQYTIGYSSDGVSSGYRKVHLETKRAGLSVQIRDGYYAGRY